MEERFEIKTDNTAKKVLIGILLFAVMAYAVGSQLNGWYNQFLKYDSYEVGFGFFMIIIFFSFIFIYIFLLRLLNKLLRNRHSIVVTDSELIVYKGDTKKVSVKLNQIGILRHCGGAAKISDSILICGQNERDELLSLKEIPKQSDVVRPLVKKILSTGNYKKEQKVFKNMMWDEYTQVGSL